MDLIEIITICCLFSSSRMLTVSRMLHGWGGGRGGACRDMLGCDWWRDGFIVLFVIIQSSEWFHLRLSSIRRVCRCNVSTPPPG